MSQVQPADLTKFQVERLGKDGQLYVFEGLKDQAGKIIVPANYDYIWEFNKDSLTLARKRIDIGQEEYSSAFVYQIISSAGYLYYEFPDYLFPEPIQEGLIRVFNDRTGRYGFMNGFGDIKIKFNFVEASDVSEGLAAVKKNDNSLWGFIDANGKMKVEPQFSEAFAFSEGLAVVIKNAAFYYLQKDGSLIRIAGDYDRVYNVQNGFSIVTKSRNDSLFYGFIDKSGKEIIAPKYDFIDNFSDQTAVFVLNGEAGMLSSDGSVLILPRYDELYRFDQDHYLFQQNGLHGLVRTDGSQVLPPYYSAIGLFYNSLCAVRRSSLWGFANTNGEEVIPCQYAELGSAFTSSTARVKLPDTWLLVSGSDTLQLPAYDEVLPYYGYAAAFRIGDYWGFLNKHGEESIEPKFDELVYNKGAIVFGRNSDSDGSFTWSVIDPYGREIQKEKYSEVVRYSNGFAAVRHNDKWGFIDASGIEIRSPQYDQVRNYSNGLAAVMTNGNWGFINKTGKEEISILSKLPSLEELKNPSFSDSLEAIRLEYPLYLMEVVGDFDGNCTCAEDLVNENSSSSPICLNKIGKLHPELPCEPYTKVADLFEPNAEINPALKVIQLQGAWITIDSQGKQIN